MNVTRVLQSYWTLVLTHRLNADRESLTALRLMANGIDLAADCAKKYIMQQDEENRKDAAG